MAIIKLKDNSSYNKDIYYEFDTDTEPLGEGGMGKVYRGRQISERTGLSRDVAIKFMFDGLPQSVIDRARREASIQVVSENLVEMMGFIDTTTEGPNNTVRHHYHVVSELLTGVMLADLLNGVTTTKDGRPIAFAQNLYNMYKEDRVNFALIIMKNIASGIMTLHDKGYIHRDIDPTNIMVTVDGKIKLIDFGIAKKLPNHNTTSGEKLSTQDRTLTMTGQFIGKPQYAAPELVDGDVNYQNETTDIYAMGMLFYQLLVGKLPFTGPVTQVLKAQKETKTPVRNITNVKNGAILRDLRYVVGKATEKLADKRYQSAAEFRVDLDAIGKGIVPRPWWLRYAIIGIAAAVVAFLIWLWPISPDPIDDVKAMLMAKDTAEKGWNLLQTKCEEEKNNADFLYLQSRIIYEGKEDLSDSIIVMKQNLSGIVKANNKEAHSLLEAAHKADPNNYKILYSLGVNSCYGVEGVVDRDFDAAQQYFTQALESAQKAGDVAMQNRIQKRLDQITD